MTQNNGWYIFKRFLSVILALAVLLLALPAWSMTANSAENSGEVMPLALTAEDIIKGSGTEGDPYLIETAGQLKMLADDSSLWDKHFRLTADIDLGGEANGSWSPIGNSTTKFTGTFDGDGHKISGLFINNTTSDQGLFGYVRGGTIKNLGVNGNVTGGQHVGGVVGRAQSSTTVQNCYNTGSVTAEYFFGGVVGSSENSTVQNCYNTGNIRDNDGGDGNFGGIVGFIINGTVQNCYNTGNVSGGTDVGGVVGYNDSCNVQNCYFLQGSASSGIGRGTGTATELTQARFANQSSFSGWDFTNTWTMSALLDRPVLTDTPEIQGDGSDGDPYRLSTAEHLKALAAKVNGGNSFSGTYFKLTEGIDLSSVCGENIGGSEVSWTPIGYYLNPYNNKPFSGTFDGGGHLISGLYINTNENSTQGLFGYIGGGTVKNLGVSGSVTSKSTYYSVYASGIGGIVGYSYNSNVQNCYNDSNVSGYYYVGGIVGQAEGSTTVQNCYNTGDIREESGYESSAYAGGIVGYNTSSNVQNCYNTGDISRGAEGNVGGIVGGEDIFSRSTISNCYYLEGTAENCSGAYTYPNSEKSEDEFKSGEVAWLLQNKQNEQVWYQKVGTEDYPVFKPYDNISVVYRVAFITKVDILGYQTVFGAFYGNSGFTVSAAPSGKPERDGYEFVRWTTDKTQTGENYEFKSVTVTDEDVEIYAVWREKFGADDDATPITITVSQGETSGEYDLDELLAYYTGAAKAAGNFTYTSRYTGKDLTVTVNGSKLTVTAADDAAVGEHVLTVTASEKSPQLSTIALADLGTSDVELTVTVTVIGNREALDEDDIEVTKSDTTITVTSPDNTDGEFEYSKDGGITWQSGNEFTGLTPGETYEISVRYKATDEYNASDSVTKNVTTTENTNGKTTLKSGETVERTGKSEDVKNKKGKVTIEDSSGNETTVTLPDGITDVEIDENGNVIIPGGSTVTPQNGTDFTVDDEAAVGADGIATLPDGGNIGFGKTDVNVPKNKPVTPNADDTLTVPDGSAVTPPSGVPEIKIENANDKATVDRDGNVTFPDGGQAKIGEITVDVPAGGTLEPVGNGYVQVPPGTKVTKDGEETVLPDGGILDKDGNIVDNLVRIGDVIVILPEGGKAKKNEDGSVTVPEGSTVIPGNGKPDYTIGENGGTVHDDGSADIPSGGSIELGETTVTAPENGGTFTPNADETVTVPDGTTVTPPNGQDITITDADNKATVDKNGKITFPEGGKANINGAEITVPSVGTIETRADGKVLLSEGTIITKDGTTLTVPKGGAVYDPATGKLEIGGSDDSSDNGSGDNSDNGSGDSSDNGSGDNSDNGSGDDSNNGSDNPDTGKPIAGIAVIILAGAVCAAAVTVKRRRT